jgi:hypothetical protein
MSKMAEKTGRQQRIIMEIGRKVISTVYQWFYSDIGVYRPIFIYIGRYWWISTETVRITGYHLFLVDGKR